MTQCGQKSPLPSPGFARDPNIYALTIKSAVPGVFSVGGDLRELSTAARERSEDARKYLAADYRLNWLLECFSKPTISLMNGLAMGSGVGLTMYGTHRVAGEDYKFAMPETGVGFSPTWASPGCSPECQVTWGCIWALRGARLVGLMPIAWESSPIAFGRPSLRRSRLVCRPPIPSIPAR